MVLTKSNAAGRRLGVITISLVHLIAFAMLYLVLVQMNWAVRDFYELKEVEVTGRFALISKLSDVIAAHTPIVGLVIALDLVLLIWLSRSGSRWCFIYSHVVLVVIGVTGFLWSAWAITPMAKTLGEADPAPAAVVDLVAQGVEPLGPNGASPDGASPDGV